MDDIDRFYEGCNYEKLNSRILERKVVFIFFYSHLVA